jgi:hypothetical protein
MASVSARHMFLIDGLGACTSALLLGVVLPAMQRWIGMPTGLLHLLAAIAALFAVNALCGYRFAGDHASRWLRVIMLANLLYCLLTGSLVTLYREELTALGTAYFVGEIMIILGLVLAERGALRRLQESGGRLT